jgi:hypothetical protein
MAGTMNHSPATGCPVAAFGALLLQAAGMGGSLDVRS